MPYAEEMKTCGYCAEGEYLAAFGIKICELGATKLYLFKEQSHRGRVTLPDHSIAFCVAVLI